MVNKKTYLSEYWVGGRQKYLNAENMSTAFKFATTALSCPYLKGIPMDRVDTHSLISGGANALSFSGYSYRDIQKMGRWRGGDFNAALMFSAFRYFFLPSTQYADKYVFLFFTFFRIDTNRPPNALTGMKFSSPSCS